MSTFKKLMSCFVILSILTLFTGCNTMHGAGEDIEKAGEGIQDAAD